MATINNQATLRVAVADWLNRTDLTTNQLDQFIEMGEAMVYETLRVPPLERTAKYSVATIDSTIDIPTGYLDLIELRKLGTGTCSVDPTVNLTREDCTASGGAWTDADKSDDVVLNRVDSRSFHENRIPYSFSRELEAFLITDDNGEQKASGEYNLRYHYAEPPIGTIIAGNEVYPYILEEYELILYSALAFGYSFLNDFEAEDKYIQKVSDKITILNTKAEIKGGNYSQAFSSSLI
jgi:hypothetical protein